MSDGSSYWDDPGVKAAEAAYEAAQKAAAEAKEAGRESARFDEQMREAKANLDAARARWQREHPGEKPPWHHAMDERERTGTPFDNHDTPFGLDK